MTKTVNPKAGTLKPINKTLRKNPGHVLRKMIAFVLMLSLVVTDLTFGQNDDSLVNSFTTVSGSSKKAAVVDTCCIGETAQVLPIRKNPVTVNLPSSAMIHRSDSEVNENLRASLKEMNLLVNPIYLNKADEEIRNNFEGRYAKINTVSLKQSNPGDEYMTARFALENGGIQLPVANFAKVADECLNSRFELENKGIKSVNTWTISKADASIEHQFKTENGTRSQFGQSDEKINSQFIMDNGGISIPKAVQLQTSDHAVGQQFMQATEVRIPTADQTLVNIADEEINQHMILDFQNK